ncbi:unnamed protein product [Amoebophrya sp. A25]|nr:unnamed protein product [Amoebophrya sp. A25]|eukprot:GSA25T00005241001.1
MPEAVKSCGFLGEPGEATFRYGENYEPLANDRFMLEIDEGLLDQLCKDNDAEGQGEGSAALGGLGSSDGSDFRAHKLPELGNKALFVGKRNENAFFVTKDAQMSIMQLKNSNSQLLVHLMNVPVSSKDKKQKLRGSSSVDGGPPLKRLKTDPENAAGGPLEQAGGSSSSSGAVEAAPVKTERILSVRTGFEDIIFLRAEAGDTGQIQRILEKEYPCYLGETRASNNVRFCSGEEMRYRCQCSDAILNDFVENSPYVVKVPDKGFQWLDLAMHDTILDTVCLCILQEEFYDDFATKKLSLQQLVHNFQFEFEFEYLVTKPILESVLRAVCDRVTVVNPSEDPQSKDKAGSSVEGDAAHDEERRKITNGGSEETAFILNTDKVLKIFATKVFEPPVMSLQTFLQKWRNELPVDFLDLEITAETIVPPMFVIRNSVVRADEESLPKDAVLRLEKLFALYPIWYQSQLETIINPVLPATTKVAAWLLKKARKTEIENPATGEEESMFVSKFGVVPLNADGSLRKPPS